MATDKKEALANALKQIEKDFGKGSIMRLGDAKAHMNVEVIPTGILPLDIALGVGGGCHVAVSLRSMGRSPRARRPLPCI